MAPFSVHGRLNRDGHAPVLAHQRTAILRAFTNAEMIAVSGIWDLNEMWDQSGGLVRRNRRRREAWRRNRHIVTWFGNDTLTPGQMRWTRIRMRRIRDQFRGRIIFDVIQHQTGRRSWLCRPGRAAYCSPATPIKLCPEWFTMDEREQTCNIIHELGHKTGHIDHRGADTEPEARQLARNEPR